MTIHPIRPDAAPMAGPDMPAPDTRLRRSRPMSGRLADLAGLIGRRLGRAARLHAGSNGFDVTSGADGAGTQAVLDLLGQFSTLSGQTHALSDDPWKFLWGRGRQAFLPFHERASTLVAWRDPVGPAECSTETIERFRAYAEHRGKHAVLLGVSGSVLQALPDCAFQSVWLGTEPFYNLDSWHTRGKAGMKVRLACNHVHRLGAAAREARPLDDARDRAAIEAVTEAWMSARPERRNQSFLRTEPLASARHRRYFVVETPGRMESFLVCSPVSRRGQYLQDLVRMPDAPRGANELAMLTAMTVFREEGMDFVTGGIVPFFDPDRQRSNEPTHEPGLLGWVIRHFDHLFHFAGLQQFRAKFVPTRVVDIYALLWPGILTPALAWDIRSLLS